MTPGVSVTERGGIVKDPLRSGDGKKEVRFALDIPHRPSNNVHKFVKDVCPGARTDVVQRVEPRFNFSAWISSMDLVPILALSLLSLKKRDGEFASELVITYINSRTGQPRLKGWVGAQWSWNNIPAEVYASIRLSAWTHKYSI